MRAKSIHWCSNHIPVECGSQPEAVIELQRGHILVEMLLIAFNNSTLGSTTTISFDQQFLADHLGYQSALQKKKLN